MCFPRLPYGLEAALVLDAQLSLKQDTSHTCSVCIHGVMQHRWQSPYELDLLDALTAERTAQSPSVSPASNWGCCWFYFSPPPAEFCNPTIRCPIWPRKHSQPFALLCFKCLSQIWSSPKTGHSSDHLQHSYRACRYVLGLSCFFTSRAFCVSLHLEKTSISHQLSGQPTSASATSLP